MNTFAQYAGFRKQAEEKRAVLQTNQHSSQMQAEGGCTMMTKPLDQIKAPERANPCNGEGYYISPTETAALKNVYREARRVPEDQNQRYFPSANVCPPNRRVNAATTMQLEQGKAYKRETVRSNEQKCICAEKGFMMEYYPPTAEKPGMYRLHSERANSWCEFQEERLRDLVGMLQTVCGMERTSAPSEDVKEWMFRVEAEKEAGEELRKTLKEKEREIKELKAMAFDMCYRKK